MAFSLIASSQINSNTTLVKVKYFLHQLRTATIFYSNTTLVKVKCIERKNEAGDHEFKYNTC